MSTGLYLAGGNRNMGIVVRNWVFEENKLFFFLFLCVFGVENEEEGRNEGKYVLLRMEKRVINWLIFLGSVRRIMNNYARIIGVDGDSFR